MRFGAYPSGKPIVIEPVGIQIKIYDALDRAGNNLTVLGCKNIIAFNRVMASGEDDVGV